MLNTYDKLNINGKYRLFFAESSLVSPPTLEAECW